MFVDVSVDHSLSFCAEALSSETEQKQSQFCYSYLFIIHTIWNLRIF